MELMIREEKSNWPQQITSVICALFAQSAENGRQFYARVFLLRTWLKNSSNMQGPTSTWLTRAHTQGDMKVKKSKRPKYKLMCSVFFLPLFYLQLFTSPSSVGQCVSAWADCPTWLVSWIEAQPMPIHSKGRPGLSVDNDHWSSQMMTI